MALFASFASLIESQKNSRFNALALERSLGQILPRSKKRGRLSRQESAKVV
jgi:hypothetical protein